jgi:hypothetical protein
MIKTNNHLRETMSFKNKKYYYLKIKKKEQEEEEENINSCLFFQKILLNNFLSGINQKQRHTFVIIIFYIHIYCCFLILFS